MQDAAEVETNIVTAETISPVDKEKVSNDNSIDVGTGNSAGEQSHIDLGQKDLEEEFSQTGTDQSNSILVAEDLLFATPTSKEIVYPNTPPLTPVKVGGNLVVNNSQPREEPPETEAQLDEFSELNESSAVVESKSGDEEETDITCIYKSIKESTNNLDGGTHADGIYGEITQNSMHLVLELMHKYCNVSKETTCFIDIGSGAGKPVQHAAPFVNISVGIECNTLRYNVSVS